MSIFDTIFPKEISDFIGIITGWFKNSGIRETLEANGTTGVQTFITKINGHDAAVSFVVSYLTEDDLKKINATLMNIQIESSEKAQETN